jgi:hypothetical protein
VSGRSNGNCSAIECGLQECTSAKDDVGVCILSTDGAKAIFLKGRRCAWVAKKRYRTGGKVET